MKKMNRSASGMVALMAASLLLCATASATVLASSQNPAALTGNGPIDPPMSSGIGQIDPPMNSTIGPIDPPMSSGIGQIDPPMSSSLGQIDPPMSSSLGPIDPPMSSSLGPIDPPMSSSLGPIDPPMSSRGSVNSNARLVSGSPVNVLPMPGQIEEIPEPATVALLGLGLLGAAMARRKTRKDDQS